ncbi:Ficolin-1, partial [Eudyptula albosignata]
ERRAVPAMGRAAPTLLALLSLTATISDAQDTCPEVRIVGLGDADRLAVLQGCPGIPGASGPKGEPGLPGTKGEAPKAIVPHRRLSPGPGGVSGSSPKPAVQQQGLPPAWAPDAAAQYDQLQKPQGFTHPQPKGPARFGQTSDLDETQSLLVFQRRWDGSVNFLRDWDSYKRGFGNQLTEFWLGNDNIHFLTSLGPCELRIDLRDFENNYYFAKYASFRVLGESEKYKLVLGDFLGGNAGDSLSYHKDMPFSTTDQDNDMSSFNCATEYKGAWWYNDCHYSNLNGMYWLGVHGSYADGINWKTGKEYHYSHKRTEMKFRPV